MLFLDEFPNRRFYCTLQLLGVISCGIVERSSSSIRRKNICSADRCCEASYFVCRLGILHQACRDSVSEGRKKARLLSSLELLSFLLHFLSILYRRIGIQLFRKRSSEDEDREIIFYRET